MIIARSIDQDRWRKIARLTDRASELSKADRSTHLDERTEWFVITRQCGDMRTSRSTTQYDAARSIAGFVLAHSSRPSRFPTRALISDDLEASTVAAGSDSVTQEVTSAWKKCGPTDLRAHSMRLRGSEQDGATEQEGHVGRRKTRKKKNPHKVRRRTASFAPTYGL